MVTLSSLLNGDVTQYHRLQYWFTKYTAIPQKIRNYDLIQEFWDRTFIPFHILHSEIDHIHLSSEAQCVSHHLPLVDCHIFDCLRSTLGVCEAQFHQGYNLIVIASIPSQNYRHVWWHQNLPKCSFMGWWCPALRKVMRLTNPLVSTMGITTIYSNRFVMELIQWIRVYRLGENELHRPPWWPKRGVRIFLMNGNYVCVQGYRACKTVLFGIFWNKLKKWNIETFSTSLECISC